MRNFNLKQLFITVFALLSCLSANAQYYVETGGIHYELYPESHTASVVSTNYWDAAPNGYSGDIVIPKAITYNGEGFRVTQISGNAFSGCQNLTSIAISDNITTIGSYAFSGCTGLTELAIPNSVTTINSYAFSGCTGLANVTIGTGVKQIGSYVFQGCTGLTSITIPDGVTTIDSYAFNNCTGLTDVTVGAKVTTIGGGAFSGCLALDSIVVDAANTVYDSRDNCNAIIETATNRLVQGCNNSTVPNSVEIIGNSAFCGFAGLTDITIGSNVKAIEANAFYNCTSLENVTLGENVETIGGSAFRGCMSLTDIKLGEKVKTIGDHAFDNCINLTNVTLGDKITNIGMGAFYGCSSLSSIKIPDSVKEIKYATFCFCTALTSVTMGKNVSSIENDAFYDCSGINDVEINNIDAWLKINFGSYSANPLYSSSYVNLLVNGVILTDIVIPDNVTVLKSYVFGRANIKSMEMPEGLKTIEYGAIPTSVTRLVFNSKTPPTFKVGPMGEECNLEHVGYVLVPVGYEDVYEALECWAINTVVTDKDIIIADVTVTSGMMGEEILNLGHISYLREVNHLILKGSINSTDIDNIKYSMPKLLSIDMSGLDMPTVPSEMFKDRRALLSIILPNNVTSIGSSAFYGCSNLGGIVLPEGLNDISSSAFSGCTSLNSISFSSTVKSIGGSAFSGCTNLVDVKFDTIVGSLSIGDYAFSSCWNLRKMDFSNLVGEFSIGGFAFNNCNGLRVIHFNDSVEKLSIYDYAFNHCGLLSDFDLPEGTTTIGSHAFINCSSLKTITFPKSLKTISYGAFLGCTALKEITLMGATSIGEISYYYDGDYDTGRSGAFEGCSKLEKVTLSDGLHEIGENTFRNCVSLASIIIPEGVETLGMNAFKGCTALKSAFLPSTLLRCGKTPFANCCKLDSVVCMSLLPPNLKDGVLTLDDMASALKRRLYVPEWTLAKYKLSSGWAAFYEILPIKGIYPSVINIYGNQILALPKDSLPASYNPDINIHYQAYDGYSAYSQPSSLNLRGNDTLRLNNFSLECNNYCNYQSSCQLINEAGITANNVFLGIYLDRYCYNYDSYYNETQAWYFLSFPFDVRISDIRTSCQWVIRRYDGAARADFDYNNTWKNMSYDGVLQAGEGYILACTGGTFKFTAMDNVNKNNIFANDTVYVHLKEYISDIAADNSWNLVGNPFPCHYDTRKMDYTAPITVWNVDNSTYSAYSPVDDSYVLKPFEAFFVQKPANVDSIAFDPAGRQLSSTAAAKSGVHRVMPKVYSTAAKRSIVNLELSNGKYSDRTRFVINESAEMDYELNCDAAKFMSTETVIPQLYTVVGDVNFAINERPLNDGVVKLGTHFGEAGKYTISMQNCSEMSVVLVDLKTGVETDMNNDCYTFDAEVGDCERFIVKLYDNNATGVKDVVTEAQVVATENGIAVTASENVDIKVYNVAGILIDERCACSETFIVAPGVYVVTVNGITHKVVVSK